MKTILPRNIIFEQETIPIDFLGNYKIEYRQIPYVLTGILSSVIIYYNDVPNKIILYIVNIGMTFLLSLIKIENQNLEKLIYNIVKYKIDKFQLRRKNND